VFVTIRTCQTAYRDAVRLTASVLNQCWKLSLGVFPNMPKACLRQNERALSQRDSFGGRAHLSALLSRFVRPVLFTGLADRRLSIKMVASFPFNRNKEHPVGAK
jgi:hypothetical protein